MVGFISYKDFENKIKSAFDDWKVTYYKVGDSQMINN
jgi:hypothetical protein